MAIAIDVVVAIIAIGTLIHFFRSRVGKHDPFPFEPRRWVPWGLVDIGLILMVMALTQAATLGIVQWVQSIVGWTMDPENLTVEDRILQMLAAAASKLLTFFIGLALLKIRTRQVDLHLGWSVHHIGKDMKQGVYMFFLVILPVVVIQFVLTFFFKPAHPIIKLLLENPSPLFFGICGVLVVFVAPLVEEFLFRVIIQGWLENLAAFWQTPKDSDRMGSTPDYESVMLGRRESPGGHFDLRFNSNPCWWPILVSALLFALAHTGHSSDPIPLFVFAVGLGYLYQRTHRILPCILVHVLLNSVSLLKLWIVLKANQ